MHVVQSAVLLLSLFLVALFWNIQLKHKPFNIIDIIQSNAVKWKYRKYQIFIENIENIENIRYFRYFRKYRDIFHPWSGLGSLTRFHLWQEHANLAVLESHRSQFFSVKGSLTLTPRQQISSIMGTLRVYRLYSTWDTLLDDRIRTYWLLLLLQMNDVDAAAAAADDDDDDKMRSTAPSSQQQISLAPPPAACHIEPCVTLKSKGLNLELYLMALLTSLVL